MSTNNNNVDNSNNDLAAKDLVYFELGSLPFEPGEFEPILSSESFSFHYNKHHKAYVDNLSKLLTSQVFVDYGMSAADLGVARAAWSGNNLQTVEDLALIYVIRKAHNLVQVNGNKNQVIAHMAQTSEAEREIAEDLRASADNGSGLDIVRYDLALNMHKKIFNNAAQHWNHAFFWQSITPAKKDISSNIAQLIEKQFGSVEQFKKYFYDMGVQLFGSGWVWLVFDKQEQQLALVPTINAETPIVYDRFVPLLVCDVWEHAYYIDYRNKRVDYLERIINQLNWEFADSNFNAVV